MTLPAGLLAALLGLAAAAALPAQDSLQPPPVVRRQGPSLGVELGYSRATLTGAGSRGSRASHGAVAGAWFRLPVASWLALQPGIRLASRGGAARIATAGGPLDLELDLVYLDLPLLLRARLAALGRVNLVLLAGGAPSARIGCTVDFSQGGAPLARASCDQPLGGVAFHGWDVGYNLGAGLAIPIERSEVALEARYYRGGRDVVTDAGLRNRAFTVSLSVPF